MSEGRRILCLDQYSELGGGQQSLLDLLPAFRNLGWAPIVAAPRGKLTEIAARNAYRVHYLEVGRYNVVKKSATDMLKYVGAIPGLVLSLIPLFTQNQIGLIYANGPRILPVAAAVSRLAQVPLVFHCHNRLLQESAITLARRALRISRGYVIACCRFAAEPLLPSLSSDRLQIIFNGVEDMGERRRAERSDSVERIGVVGRIEPQKGHLEFVRAARVISTAFPECRFLVIGSPLFSGAAFFDRVVQESRGLNFEFRDWTEDVSGIFRDLDLLVVPSKAVEATTRVILEAFSARVPVVAFRSGGIPEVLRDGVNGFLTAESTAGSLARRIMDVLEMSPHRLRTICARARCSWEEEFTLTGYRERVCKLLAGLFACGPDVRQPAARIGAARSASE